MDKLLFSDLANKNIFDSFKDKVREICKPLLSNTPISFYSFERYYYDGSYMTLSADSEVLPEYAKQEKVMPDIDLISLNTSHYVFLSEEIALPPIPDVDLSFFANNFKLAKDLLGITHRLSLTFDTQQYIEIHIYGIKTEVQNVVYFFMNHLKILEFFCKYFRSAAQHLIAEAEKTKVFILPINSHKQVNNSITFANNYKIFFKEICSRKHHLVGKRGVCSLSVRELECLTLTAGNKTAKEIGKLLCLSPRTVEEYLNTLRSKLGCQAKLELIQIAHDNPIINTFAELFNSDIN